ncbi:restriction endonuclease, type I [Deinococcus grandis]|uniref:Restriction endonuclease, type I n=1 Tax=Deinococcus grandis TaxID=57498 RepID=A0A100HHB1_9DEIO|nr:DUF4357 domain-containing protein [Deinococcus grandis]BBN95946.1 hypothetical protein DEGR_26790 [Deinococcus grandis]GAQ20572.1 restriction endonuclease, type I [Deinococcus grandis]
MSSRTDAVQEAVTHIQAWLAHAPPPGEAIVRQAVVLRLLHAAGFDIWNPAEVVPEETNGAGHRADFLIRAGSGTFALELKGMTVTLGPRDYQQVVTYAASEKTPWAVLTNGRVWAVLDRLHQPGGTFEEHEVLRLELGREPQPFADDFALLFDPAVWRADGARAAVARVQAQQQRRLDEARILREKTPVVADVQRQFGIASFALAAQAAAEMNRVIRIPFVSLTDRNSTDLLTPRLEPASLPLAPLGLKDCANLSTGVRITQQERDVLLGAQTPAGSAEAAGGVRFTFRALGCAAQALYLPGGTWRLLAGSQCAARRRDEPGWQKFMARRDAWVADGTLRPLDDARLELTRDLDLKSASEAAAMVCVRPVNGWDAWKDAQGRPAQHWR